MANKQSQEEHFDESQSRLEGGIETTLKVKARGEQGLISEYQCVCDCWTPKSRMYIIVERQYQDCVVVQASMGSK